MAAKGGCACFEEPAVRDLVQGVFEVRRQSNTDTVLPYIDALSAVRLGLSAPDEVEARMPDAQGLAEGFETYRDALAEAGAVDFDEQIYRAIEILLRHPDARSAAQGRCRHLLVDEFQDLNPAHMLLIRLLCAPAYNCFGVGDDDQVIYGYTGATPEYLINFGTTSPVRRTTRSRSTTGARRPLSAPRRPFSPTTRIGSPRRSGHHPTAPTTSPTSKPFEVEGRSPW